MKTKPVFKSTEGKNAVMAFYDSLLARWPVPYEEINIETRLGETFIIASGGRSAHPLILLHGTSSNSSFWLGDIAEYSRGYRVYSVDIIGEPGKSGDIQLPIKGTDYEGWLLDILNQLDIRRTALLGTSLGGWLAVKFSVRHPERVEKLVLLSPSGIGRQKYSYLFSAVLLSLLGQKGFAKSLKILSGGQSIPDEVLGYVKLIALNFNQRFITVPVFSDAELSRLTMPTLLCAGEKDVLLDSNDTAGRLTKLLPDVQTEVLPDQGHMLLNLTPRYYRF